MSEVCGKRIRNKTSHCQRPAGHDGPCDYRRVRQAQDGDVSCQLCGWGPRSVLSKHVVNAHPEIGIAGYRKLFGYDSLTSENFRINMRSMWQDHAEDGKQSTPYQRQKTCKKGHRWTASNTMWVEVTYRGKRKMQRRCRKCEAAKQRAAYARKHPIPAKRKCHCGKVFKPTRAFQIHCSKQCAWKASHAKRATTTAGREAQRGQRKRVRD